MLMFDEKVVCVLHLCQRQKELSKHVVVKLH